MKSSPINGAIQYIPNCRLRIPNSASSSGVYEIGFKVLPEISDSKSASYSDETTIARAFPIKTFSHGENRSINVKFTFIVQEDSDAVKNLQDLRAIQSAVYPRGGTTSRPYVPPPICQFKCGSLLSASYLCMVMKSYSVNFPTDVAWYSSADGHGTYVPYKFEVSCDFDVVFPSVYLPGQEKIITDF
jgi:hypothetical protein